MADSEEAREAAFNEMLDVVKQIGMEKLDEYGNASYPELKAEYEKVTESGQNKEQNKLKSKLRGRCLSYCPKNIWIWKSN